MRLRSRVVLLCLSAALAACGQGGAPAPVSSAVAPAISLPPDLQSIYDRSCKACHSDPATGAPQSGDVGAWASRRAQGADALLDHTLNGYKAMPPLGACMDCSEDQFRALIAYMARLESRP